MQLVSHSPYGYLQAMVEEAHDAVYFHLFGSSPEVAFPFKSCWVANRIGSDATLDNAARQEQGLPVLLPASYCNHPEGAPPLAPELLSVVWFEEGDGAALLEDGEVLAVIPSWSGKANFHGYARDCIKSGWGYFPLEREHDFPGRCRRAQEFWNSWKEGLWESYRDTLLESIYAPLGELNRYLDISAADQFPPRGLAVLGEVAVTVGMSLCPQPAVEVISSQASALRRIELALQLPPGLEPTALRELLAVLSGLAAYPWKRTTWLGEGHRVPLGRFGPATLRASREGAPQLRLPRFRGDAVRLLWVVPERLELPGPGGALS